MTHPIQKLAVLCLAACCGASLMAQGCEDPAVLRFASIPKSDGAQQQQTLRPLMKELERVLQRRVEVARSNSYGAVVESLHAGNVDLAELGPASYALLMERGPSVTAFATLSRGQQGEAAAPGSYRAVLVVRADSGLRTIRDLQGKTLSLTDPVSTSGALLPMQAVLKLTGQPVERYFSRVTYAGSHLRALEAVHKSLVNAAFVSSRRVEEYGQNKPGSSKEFAVLWQSPPIPNDPFVYRSNLCPAIVEKIRGVFFGAAPVLQPMFSELGGRHFVPASDADYHPIRELVRPQ